MSTPFKKKMFGQPRSAAGRVAKTISISLYPRHLAVLQSRERELNISRSILLQILMELEERKGLLRRELIARLTHSPPASVPAPGEPPADHGIAA